MSEIQKWQPIETAPRDSTEFLGWFCNGDVHVVYLTTAGKCRREMDDEAWSMPTHWMPLPESPEC